MSARTGMSNLITRLRPMVADSWQRHQDTATGDGSTKTFWLTHNPQASGGTVAQGGTVTGTANYSWDTTYGRVEFTSAPANSVAVTVEYMTARFTDDELQQFLDAGVTLIRDEALMWLPETIAGGSLCYQDCKTDWRDLEEASGGTTRWVIRDSTGGTVGTAAYTPNYESGVIRFTANQGGTSYYLTAYSYDLNAAAADAWMRKAADTADWYSFQSEGQRFQREQAHKQAKEMASYYRARAGQNGRRSSVQVGQFVRTDLRSW